LRRGFFRERHNQGPKTTDTVDSKACGSLVC
jgi:hypothetical protein